MIITAPINVVSHVARTQFSWKVQMTRSDLYCPGKNMFFLQDLNFQHSQLINVCEIICCPPQTDWFWWSRGTSNFGEPWWNFYIGTISFIASHRRWLASRSNSTPHDRSLWFNQPGRSPKVVALVPATSYIIKFLQLHDTIQTKWNFTWIDYSIAIRSHEEWYKKMCKISSLVPNFIAVSCYMAGKHSFGKVVNKVMPSVWFGEIYTTNAYLYFVSNTWVPSFARCRLTNDSRKTKCFPPFAR